MATWAAHNQPRWHWELEGLWLLLMHLPHFPYWNQTCVKQELKPKPFDSVNGMVWWIQITAILGGGGPSDYTFLI